MGLVNHIELTPLVSIQGGSVNFFSPQRSDQTLLVEVPPQTIDNLFCHRSQTDQLFVVRGSMVLAILQNRQYQYFYLTQECPLLVKIPPGVPHAAINLTSEPCWVINALIHRGSPSVKDYQPLKRPFDYDLDLVRKLQGELQQVCL